MNDKAFETFLEQIPHDRVLVLGDLMIDEYLWCETDRISPEAPVPIVDVRSDDIRLGGAGNVINNLRALGAGVWAASVVGDDADGMRLRAMLDEIDIPVEGVMTVPERRTARKTRVLASNQQIIRIDRESREGIPQEFEKALIDYVRLHIGEVQVVLLSDYGKGVLTVTLIQEVIRMCHAHAVPVVIDPKGDDYTKYRGATLVTPNRKEAQAAARMQIVDEQSLVTIGTRLREQLDLEALAITRSEEGMSLFLRDGQHLVLPTRAREVYDVSGAGDTVTVMFGLALACRLSMQDAAEAANVAAGVVVGKVGTSTVGLQELLAAVGSRHADADRKITPAALLKNILAGERQRGRKVVFTNGCFDLLHVGHVKYLEAARQCGDLLVLGLNSDDSIRRLKGPGRPLIGQDERAHILAALSCIDYVVIFDEDTPLSLITELKPDVLVKGGDYTPEGVVGRDLVESYGGHVELITFVDGRSTTNIINKILESYAD